MTEEYEIESVLRKERFYRDTNQWNKWRNCYHPDTAQTFIKISWFTGDIDSWVTGSKKMAAQGVALIHVVHPVEITVNGTKALAIANCNIENRMSHKGSEFDLNAWLRLIYRLERVDGAWKVLQLYGLYLRDSIVPQAPDGNTPVFDIDSVEDARSSYKCLTWNIKRRGGNISNDLPGADNEESVNEIMDTNYAWIEDRTVGAAA